MFKRGDMLTKETLTQYGSQVTFQCFEEYTLDLFDAHAQKLFGGQFEEFFLCHDFALSHSGDTKGHTLSRLHTFTLGLERKDFERQYLHIVHCPPRPCPATDGHLLLVPAAAPAARNDQCLVRPYGVYVAHGRWTIVSRCGPVDVDDCVHTNQQHDARG